MGLCANGNNRVRLLVLGSLLLEVFSAYVREALGETNQCKTERTVKEKKQQTGRLFFTKYILEKDIRVGIIF